ncbi:MAG: CocE/NonD family hydrolase [Burkholderiales bacterium]|nr:CocE/NonD family hydrolase [Burkholderiales bacterium]
MKIMKWVLPLCVSLLAACGGGGVGTGNAGPEIPVVGLSEFRRAVAGHRMVEVGVAGADGTRLATYVYLPAQGAGPFPTLVMRTPYELPITPVSGFPEDHANAEIEARAEDVGWTEATDRGYALVVQVMRGRHKSDGMFSLFLGDEVGDGDALIRWVERQPWSNGRIGIFGDSASGVASLQAAASGRSSIKAVYAQNTSTDFLGGVIFPEGRIKWEALLPFVLRQSFDNSKDHDARLGLTAAQIGALKGQAGDALEEMSSAIEAGDPAESDWWTRAITPDFPIVSQLYPRWGEFLATGRNPAALAALDVTDRIRAPVLHVSLWHDFFQASAFKAFGRLQAARGDQKLIVLDGTHYDIDDPELWPTKPMFAWFDHWLKGEANGAGNWPAVQYVLAGQPDGELRSSPVWPPAGTASAVSTLAAPERALTIDPSAPVPTLGGSHLTVSSGMLDQTPLLERDDVAQLQGTPLSAAALLLGTAEAELTVLEAGTGDIVVKLVDRRSDGEVRLLREAVVTLSGAGTRRVSFAPLAYAFDAGSAPGLVVAGASLPGYRSMLPPLAGTVRLGGAKLALPMSAQ